MKYPIQVIQGGQKVSSLSKFDKVCQESTEITDLHHNKYTISLPRYDYGTAYKSFFICMRDEPEFDFGGRRHSDGQGFSAFGNVISGYDVVEKIFARSEAEEYLNDEILIKSVRVIL